jgi:hypothetical protein
MQEADQQLQNLLHGRAVPVFPHELLTANRFHLAQRGRTPDRGNTVAADADSTAVTTVQGDS